MALGKYVIEVDRRAKVERRVPTTSCRSTRSVRSSGIVRIVDLGADRSECPQFAHHVGYLSKVTLALISPMLSPARPRLITEDRVVAEHPDDDGTFWQRLDLDRRMCLIGGTVPHHRRAGRLAVRIAHRAAVQQEHCDQRGGGWQRPAFGVGSHLFSPM